MAVPGRPGKPTYSLPLALFGRSSWLNGDDEGTSSSRWSCGHFISDHLTMIPGSWEKIQESSGDWLLITTRSVILYLGGGGGELCSSIDESNKENS